MKQFFSIGEIRYDVILPKEERIYHQKLECVGGIAVCCSFLLAKWKKNVHVIGAVGKDLYGNMIIDSLVRMKVKTKYIRSFVHGYTRTGYLIGKQFYKFQDERILLEPISLENKIKNSKENFFLFDGEEYGCAEEIAKSVSGIKILCVDTYKKEMLSLVKWMDYVVLSKEVALLFSGVVSLNASYEEIYQGLKAKIDTHWIILDEQEGCFAEIDQQYVHMNIGALKENTTHLYPAFLGAFAYFLSEEKPLFTSVQLAWVTAILATKKPGFRFAIPDLDEVMAYDQ